MLKNLRSICALIRCRSRIDTDRQDSVSTAIKLHVATWAVLEFWKFGRLKPIEILVSTILQAPSINIHTAELMKLMESLTIETIAIMRIIDVWIALENVEVSNDINRSKMSIVLWKTWSLRLIERVWRILAARILIVSNLPNSQNSTTAELLTSQEL